LISQGQFDTVVELLTETFKISPRLCVSENYIVFIFSILKKLEKTTKKANEGITNCVDIIRNSSTFKQSKVSSITLYLADVMLKNDQYEVASKLYELAKNDVISLITYRDSKKLN